MTEFWRQVAVLGRRSIKRTLRQPASVIPPITFPLILLAVNTGGLRGATDLEGFPTESFLDFALGFAFLQGAVFATMNGGTDLARDVQTGFLNRLALTPVHTVALIFGQLAGVAFLAVVQGVVFLAAGLAAGATIQAGAAGAIVILVLSFIISAAFAGVGALLAVRTGSGEAIQGVFPLVFAGLFLSSMNMPRNLIDAEWFRIIATINPVSYLIEGLRSMIIDGWDAQALLLGFGLAGAILLVGVGGAIVALRSRLERT